MVSMGWLRSGWARTRILALLWIVAGAVSILIAVGDSPSILSKISNGIAALSGLATLVSALEARLRNQGEDRVPAGDPTASATVEADADRLADAVFAAWSDEFRIRRERLPLFDRALSVRWAPAEEDLSGPVDVVGAGPADRSGTVAELVGLFNVLPLKRIVILGAPGSGKSVALAQLTLDLLAQRKRLLAEHQPGGPVPVPMSMESWDPRQDLPQWLITQLIGNFSLSAGRKRRSQAVARDLVEGGLILPVLDGLDEMPAPRRPEAIRQINRWLSVGGERALVLTCRTDDYRNAVAGKNVVLQSYAVQLQPLKRQAAQEYLRKAAPGGGAQRTWEAIHAHVRKNPDGPLAMALQSPLMVALTREIYCDGPDNPRDLLDEQRFATQQAIESHLLGRMIEATYQDTAERGGGSQGLVAWPEGHPERWLRYLARQVDDPATPNIAWWHLERSMSPLVTGMLPIALATIPVAVYLRWPTAVVFAVLALAASAGWAGRSWTLERALRKPDKPGQARWIALTVGRVVAAAAGVAYGYYLYFVQRYGPVAVSAVPGVMFGMAVGLAVGFFTISLRGTPTEMRVMHYRGITAFLRRFLAYLLMGSAATGTMWLLFHAPYTLLVVSVVFVVFGLVDSINVWLDVPADVTSALEPRSTRRSERFAALARSITVAATLAAVILGLYAIAGSPADAVAPALIFGGAYALTDRLMGLATSVWGRYIMAKMWAAIRGELPWRLMRFLDDAHRRGVLRRAGAVYQFRHARLQQYLAIPAEGDRR
jgi:hypothetical protein